LSRPHVDEPERFAELVVGGERITCEAVAALRDRGIAAEATCQATRGAIRSADPLWRVKTWQEGRATVGSAVASSGRSHQANRLGAIKAWINIGRALEASEHPDDRRLAADNVRFVRESPFRRERLRQGPRDASPLTRERAERLADPGFTASRPGPEMSR
jgi:hypothetical protein